MNADERKKVILVTGASTGIGLALSRQLAESDIYITIATARPSSLPRFAEAGLTESDTFLIRPLDVTCPGQSNLFDEIEERWGGVDILVNNAGVSYRAVQEHIEEKDKIEQFAVNYFGPIKLIRRALPHIRAQRWGRIINVS
jgi:NAD(P)-dependent dehydrogenase (short-subunit alcohol dehydrogenase family)